MITSGAMLGALLGGYEIDISWWGWYSLPSLVCVWAVELPSNCTAVPVPGAAGGSPGAAAGRAAAAAAGGAWMVAGVWRLGTAESIGARADAGSAGRHVAGRAIGVGAAAPAAGMVMTAGVLRLTAMVASACVDRSIASLGRRVTDCPPRWDASSNPSGQPLAGPSSRDCACGCGTPAPWSAWGAMIEHCRGLGGDLPAVNFIGPKVWGVPLLESTDRYGYNYGVYSDRFAIVSTVLAVWLMTSLKTASITSRQQTITRWMPTALIGLAIGLSMTIEKAVQIRDSYWAAGLIVGIEAGDIRRVPLSCAAYARPGTRSTVGPTPFHGFRGNDADPLAFDLLRSVQAISIVSRQSADLAERGSVRCAGGGAGRAGVVAACAADVDARRRATLSQSQSFRPSRSTHRTTFMPDRRTVRRENRWARTRMRFERPVTISGRRFRCRPSPRRRHRAGPALSG